MNATELTTEDSRFEKHDHGWTVTLTRRILHPANRVWTFLTDTEHLPLWLAPGEMELRQGGPVRIDFQVSGSPIDSVISELQPERLLVYAWSDEDNAQRPLRWQLQPEGETTRLRLTLHLAMDEPVAKYAAGWDTHLEMLLAALEGMPISFPVSRFRESREIFTQRIEHSAGL